MTLHFEQELAVLKDKLLTMAGHAESAVNSAIKAVLRRDDDLARQVKEADSVMDQLEIEIDDAAIQLLAKAPLASDLRLITVAMKISHDLERVGDEATTIARRSLKLNQEPELQSFQAIPQMAEVALSMLREALDAFVNRSPGKAREVIPRDKVVDALNKQFHKEMIKLMQERQDAITRGLHLMVISKSLERIADHATNIAEDVVYLYEAKDIRHSGKGQSSAPKEAA